MRTAHGPSCPLVFVFPVRTTQGRSRPLLFVLLGICLSYERRRQFGSERANNRRQERAEVRIKSIDSNSDEAGEAENQTNCLIWSWPNNQVDSDNSRIGRSLLKATSVNRVNVPLRAILVNSPILYMCINTPRANVVVV